MAGFTFDAEVVHWRGPAPYYFAAIPEEIGSQIAAKARELSYGWGVIPVQAEINGVRFTTSLFPRDGSYLLPLKVKVRQQLGGGTLETVRVAMTLGKA